MNLINSITTSLKEVVGIDNEYVILGILSIIVILVGKIIYRILIKIYSNDKHKARDIFKFSQRINVIINIVLIFIIFVIWEGYLSNIVTIISFISAGATIALREVILNFFAGIYIKAAKPFVVEDRIEVGNVKGDIVLISSLSFKVLEIGDRVNGEQSSGIIVNIPNSFIFSNSLKNYTTVFKYIWSELCINIPLDADVNATKKVLYKIINSNNIIKEIPKKMDKAIDAASTNYRIYYNNLKPIIYTSFVDNHIELCIRFLVHPKKERNVIDDLWIKIIKEHNLGNIKLYIKS